MELIFNPCGELIFNKYETILLKVNSKAESTEITKQNDMCNFVPWTFVQPIKINFHVMLKYLYSIPILIEEWAAA